MSCAANVSLTVSKRRPRLSCSPPKSSSRRRPRLSPNRLAAVASARTSISLSGMSTWTVAPYSGLSSMRRHFRFMARDTRLLLAFETFRALSLKRSAMVSLQSEPFMRALTIIRLNFTITIFSPALIAPPSLLTLLFNSSSKSLPLAPLTRTNSSLIKSSQSSSVSPASLQLAQTSAAARTSPIFFTAAYSLRFKPLLMASAFACSRQVFRSPVQLLEGFISTLLRLRFTIDSASSPERPAPSFLSFTLVMQLRLSPPDCMQAPKTSPRTPREASFSTSWIFLDFCDALCPALM
mmetsp:Transcript_56212/g.167177  ORF Transcript_56212/g.167177 Transcript_56212/m.167177 type:complete len:294 (-) Transcript_56212:1047-1928(-)